MTENFPIWLPKEIRQFYIENGVSSLFAWQSKIVNEAAHAAENILFSAPTGAGKSIVAELIALNVAQSGRKVLFVLPYISVAKEKLYHLQKCWRRADIVVSGFFGPNSVAPNEWIAAVCTIEKAASLLNRSLTDLWCDKIGMIVVDELHMIFDMSRGITLEYLLAKVLFWNKISTNNIRLIGMSATIPQIQILGTWMSAKVFEADFRPIELSEFAVCQGQIYSFEKNKAGREVRKLVSREDPCLTVALDACRRGKQTLLFCSSKAETEKMSVELAKILDGLYRCDAIFKCLMEKIKSGLLVTKKKLDQAGCVDRCLYQSLARGVAFHHAGLTMEERENIEDAFRFGHLLVLVCTSTLASGVNLPAEVVIIKTQLRGPAALTATSYKQMVGRAGRMGHSLEGETYLTVSNNNELDQVTKLFGLHDERRSHLRADVSRLLLECICTGLASSYADLEDVVACLLNNSACDIQTSMTKLLTNSFVSEQVGQDGVDGVELAATQLGRATLASSLPPEAALFIFDDLNNASRSVCLDTELHMLYLVTPVNVSVWQDCDWNHLYELFSRIPTEQRRVAKLIGISEKYLLERLQGQWNPASDKKLQVHIRFFSALALFDLINEVSLHEVSTKYRIARGCLQTLQHQSATYAAMIVAFCARLGWLYLRALLDGFAMRLFFGIRSELSQLVSVDGIDGRRARVLHEHDVTCISQLAACDSKKLANILSLAVAYSSNDKNDGKREWLFGNYRMGLDEAAATLKARARAMLLEQVRELGFSVLAEKLAGSAFESEPRNENETHSTADSGVASLACSQYVLADSDPKRVDKSAKEEDEDELQDFNRTMQDLSLLEPEDDVDEKSDGEFADTGICADVNQPLDSLETTLLKVQPPTKKNFYKCLSEAYRYTAETSKLNITLREQRVDSFDSSIVLQGKIFNKPLTEKRRISCASVLSAQNASFDVFRTPPSMTRSAKHKRSLLCTDFPFSPTASPIHKLKKFDAASLEFDNVCRNENVWLDWIRDSTSWRQIGVAFLSSAGVVQAIFVSNFAKTVFIPFVENLPASWANECGSGDFSCKIAESQRVSILKTLFCTAKTFMFSIDHCFLLFNDFKIEVNDAVIVSVVTYTVQKGDDTDSSLTKLIFELDWEFDVKDAGRRNRFAMAALHAFSLQRIYAETLTSANEASSKESVELELQAAKVVLKMFYDGIPFDGLACASAITKLRQISEDLQRDCFALARTQFNLDSSREVAKILFCRLKLIHPGRQNANKLHLSTSKCVLEQIRDQNPIVEKILKYRHITYAISNCLKPLLESSSEMKRVRCTFEVCTATGRILSSHPNIQNVPKKESFDGFCARDLFRARPGYTLVGSDYSQLELRVLAHLSNDKKLLMFFAEGRDLFAELSAQWGFERAAVKQLCYGLIYGMGVKSLRESTNLSKEQAEQLWREFFALFPKVKTYISETKDRAKRDGFVSTLLGRKKLTHGSGSAEERAREDRVMVNYTIQGTASEIFKAALVAISRRLKGKDARLVMTVHDEVLVETKDELAADVGEIVRACMHNALAERLNVPLQVSLHIAPSWAKLK